MQATAIPGPATLVHVDTWVFDLDNTLYHPRECDLFPQMDRRMIQYICDLLGLDEASANRHRETYFRSYGTTLRGLMEVHGVRPEAFLAYVHEIDLTQLAPNPRLGAALDRLPGRKLVFTNATERHAAAVLERLGIADRFEAVFDVVAAEFVPKPHPPAYAAFLKRHGVSAAGAIMFEDTARNLAPAAALGMTTAWIRTDRPFGQPEPDCNHIHHVIDDLTLWVEAAAQAIDGRMTGLASSLSSTGPTRVDSGRGAPPCSAPPAGSGS